ncbi:hypothetical protein [Acetobacter sp. A11-2]|uniref:hypothetical protein n=1 Tax=Acetobacter sp. A11-2 TaxID=3157859 RepID=UPI0032EE62C6
MNIYVIVAAAHENAVNHLNSKFKMYRYQEIPGEDEWKFLGWKNIHFISDKIKMGNKVLTGKFIANNEILTGEPVEIELRIAKDKKKYKISEMPDK